MRARTKLSAAFAAAALTTIATPFGATPAHAETFHDEIEFSRTHECTHEDVIGETRVHVTTTTTDNGDGTTTVHVKQHAHGSHLVGFFSGDEYVLNEKTDVDEEFIVSTSLGGAGSTKTTFNHKGEEQAFTEVPGQDDLWQRVTFVIPPLGGDPQIVMADTRCH